MVLTSMDHRKAKALAKAPYIHHMDEPDEQSRKELQIMYKMGLPTCFLNSPRSLDSDNDEVYIVHYIHYIVCYTFYLQYLNH